MRGKNQAAVQRGVSVGSDLNMNLFTDDPLLQGLAMFGNNSLLLSHTPPNNAPGSYETSHMKRQRAGSISGRLRSASDLEERGLIDKSQKGILKDLIISGDSELHVALDMYDRGDTSQLEGMMDRGLLDRRDSLDLLQDLDFGIMDLGMSGTNIPSLPDSDVNIVMSNINTQHADNSDNGNDTIDTVGRKNSGGRGGDFGQGAGGGDVKGSGGGDAVSTAGGGNAEASSVAMCGVVTEGLRRGRSSTRKAAALNSRSNLIDSVGGGDGRGGASLAARNGRDHCGVIDGNCGGGGDGGGEQEIDGTDSDQQFDIGDMAFDAAFDYDGQEDDVDMKDGAVDEETERSIPLAKVHGATLDPTAVGPLHVVDASRQQHSRLASNTQDNDGRDHHEGPGGIDDDVGSRRHVVGAAESARLGDHDHHHHAGAGRADGRHHHHGVVVGVEEDDDAAVLASYGILEGGPTAPIGEFSPQFKFSFTDEIHLDLGSGLKDELRDLDSLSEPFPDQHGCSKGGESYSSIMGMHGAGGPAFRQQHQLLSRGGPVVKTEATAVPPSSTASQTTVRLTSAALAAAAPAGVHHRPDFVVVGARKRDSASPGRGSGGGGGYYSSAAHISSSAGGRHANPATASGGGTGGATSTAGDPHGVSAANSGGTHLHHHNAEVASHAQQASTSSHGTGAVRGRPVVSGMGIMVGRGPPPHHQRSGVGGAGGGDEDRKFVGAYSPEARRKRIERFHEKREHRVWTKMVKYDVRKNFADTRMRVKGRFVKKEDEALLREVMACA